MAKSAEKGVFTVTPDSGLSDMLGLMASSKKSQPKITNNILTNLGYFLTDTEYSTPAQRENVKNYLCSLGDARSPITKQLKVELGFELSCP
jgi:hypothetical protein